MVVLGGAVVDGAVLVGAVLTLVVGGGATGSVLVVLLADGDVAVLVVIGVGVVVDVEGVVEPPLSLVSSMIPKITSASKAATSTPSPTRAAGLRCHGVEPGSGTPGCSPWAYWPVGASLGSSGGS
jgi:hypothetical protein